MNRDNKIIFNGEEYKDILHISTTIHYSLFDRIKNLFCPEIVFKHDVYIKGVDMPPYHVEPKFHSVSYLRKLSSWYYSKTRTGGMELQKETNLNS